MEVEHGYKQTDIGLLPDDWDAGHIERAVERLEAGASVNSDKDEAPDFASYPCVLKTGAAKGGSLNPLESKKVARRDLWRLKVALRKGTVLVSRMNTVELVGESGYVDADYPNLFVPDRMWMATLRASVDPRWFSYVLTWQPVKSRISASATGTSGSMKNISKPSLRAVRIPYPAVEEQRAIATALSDVDALLGGLDRLIAKKRDLKQATMQQFLAGQTRLPGFHGEWELKRLGETGTFLKGSGVKKDEANTGDLPCIRYGEIYTHHNDYIRSFNSWISSKVAATATRLRQGDLLFAGSGETKEEIGKCVAFVDDCEAFAGGDIVILRLAGANSMFMGYYCNTASINAQKASKGQGDAVVHISAAALSSVEVTLPPHDEQVAIAAVLSDMYAELAALEARRDKTRALKQAMMQELLTGRTRLV